MGPELILLIPIVIWIYLRFRQNKLIATTVKMMEETGQMFHGQIQGKPKLIIVVAVDRSGTILDARLIQMLRITKPATAYELPEIVGKKLDSLVPAKITSDIETRAAMGVLIQSYITATSGRREERIIKVQSKRAIQRPNLK